MDCYNLEMYWEIMQFINEFIMNLLNYTVNYTFTLIYINLANFEFIKFIKLIEFSEWIEINSKFICNNT